MQFSIEKKEFKRLLDLVVNIIPARPTHPILNNILLDVGGNTLKLTATDLSDTMVLKTDNLDIIETGSATFPAKILTQLINKLPDENQINFKIEESPDPEIIIATIKSGRSKFKIQGNPSYDYPEEIEIKGEELEIDSDILKKGLDYVVPFCSTDETKQLLTGVYLEKKESEISFKSTNSHVLGRFNSEIDTACDDFSFVLSGKCLKRLTSLIESEGEDKIKIVRDDIYISFEIKGQKILGRALLGEYPDVDRLIPSDFKGEFTCENKALRSALDRCGLMATSKNSLIIFEKLHNELTVLARESSVGFAKETISIIGSGDEDCEIGFNIKYLLAGIKAINTTEITFSFNEPRQAVTISPLGEDNFLFLIMPVEIKD